MVADSRVGQREALIVSLLRNHDLGVSSLAEGVKGDSGSVGLLPHAARCKMRTGNTRVERPRCTCWLRSVRELERCLSVMRETRRPLWWHVHERYVQATRKPMLVKVSHWQPLVDHSHVEVIGLLNKSDLSKRGDGETRVLVELWRPGVDPLRVRQGVQWLAETFQGSPELPVELLQAAA